MPAPSAKCRTNFGAALMHMIMLHNCNTWPASPYVLQKLYFSPAPRKSPIASEAELTYPFTIKYPPLFAGEKLNAFYSPF